MQQIVELEEVDGESSGGRLGREVLKESVGGKFESSGEVSQEKCVGGKFGRKVREKCCRKSVSGI